MVNLNLPADGTPNWGGPLRDAFEALNVGKPDETELHAVAKTGAYTDMEGTIPEGHLPASATPGVDRVIQNADGTYPATRPNARSVDVVQIVAGTADPAWMIDGKDFLWERA